MGSDNQLYRGYVRTENKQCTMKFKDNANLLTLEETRKLDEYAGILAPGTALIDIDDEQQSETLMNIVESLQLNCKVICTTRGKHFLFKDSAGLLKKCATHTRLACGLTADIKIGNRNAYEVLKFGGEERFCEWDTETGEYDELPKWLIPVKSDIDFANLDEGSGRNDSLYRYILTLCRAGFGKAEARECLKIINDHVLADALSEDELDVILRDDAFPEDVFSDGKRFAHEAFADFILANDHVKRINGQLHIYHEGAYVEGAKYIEAAMIKQIPSLKSTSRTEVLKLLELRCIENERVSSAEHIAFKNGVYNVSTGEFRDLTPDIVVTNKIPWDYNPSAYCEICDTTLNKLACGDMEIRALLEECIGYCFYRRNELSKAFILTGEKSNGKSTFLDMVKDLLGEDNFSALDLAEMQEKFSIATLAGKLANIGDDISDEFQQGRSVALFKKIVSGNRIKAEFKGQDTFFFNPYVKLLFSANDIPRIKDKTGAVMRRLVIIPFNARFSKADPDFDPYITYKLKSREVMEYLIALGIKGLHRVLENNAFTECESVTDELREYEIQNNPVLLYLSETSEEDLVNNPTVDAYRAYRVFCAENGYHEMTRTTFTREINKRLGLVTRNAKIGGKVLKVFQKP